MDLADPAEHLLRDPAVVGVTLRGGPQLAQVVDLAQVGPEVPAHVEGQGHDVLGDGRSKIALEPGVRAGRSVDSAGEGVLHPELGKPWRKVVAERGTEELALLRQHAVAVEVAIGGEVGHDLELVLRVLEGAGCPLPSVGAVRKEAFEYGRDVCG